MFCFPQAILTVEGLHKTFTLHTEAGPVDLTALSDRQMARIRGREIGYVSQFLNAPPRVNPLRLVTEAALHRGLDALDAEEAATVSLTKLGVEEKPWAVDCSVLSGGERQRVNLPAGTVSPPKMLLLDEPVSALDPATRAKALAVIEDLQNQDVSVLAIYHDMNIIRRVAGRVLLRKGVVKLPQAIALLTSGPARVAGFNDRGSITPGLIADFTLIDDRGGWPFAVTTLKATLPGGDRS